MKNHIQLSAEKKNLVLTVMWVTDVLDMHTSHWFLIDLREPRSAGQRHSSTRHQWFMGCKASIWAPEIQKKMWIWHIDLSSLSSECILDWYYIHFALTFYSGRACLNSVGRFPHKVPNENSSFRYASTSTEHR